MANEGRPEEKKRRTPDSEEIGLQPIEEHLSPRAARRAAERPDDPKQKVEPIPLAEEPPAAGKGGPAGGEPREIRVGEGTVPVDQFNREGRVPRPLQTFGAEDKPVAEGNKGEEGKGELSRQPQDAAGWAALQAESERRRAAGSGETHLQRARRAPRTPKGPEASVDSMAALREQVQAAAVKAAQDEINAMARVAARWAQQHVIGGNFPLDAEEKAALGKAFKDAYRQRLLDEMTTAQLRRVNLADDLEKDPKTLTTTQIVVGKAEADIDFWKGVAMKWAVEKHNDGKVLDPDQVTKLEQAYLSEYIRRNQQKQEGHGGPDTAVRR